MDKERIDKTKYIASLFAAFGQSGDGARIAIYYRMLKDVPLDALKLAIDKLILESKYLPTIAEIREALKALMEEANGTRIKTWQEAQAEIARGITKTWFKGCLGEIPQTHEDYGKPCEPMWSTPEIKAAVDSYGMDNIAMVNASDMPIVWSQLRKAYEQACQRKKEKEVNTYVLEKGGEKLQELTNSLSDKLLLKG